MTVSDAAATPLIFYTRTNCKLCQQAETLLQEWDFRYETIDIAGNEDLIARYGHHVPVLTLGLPSGERVLHKGPLNRTGMPALKLRLVRLRREQQRQSTAERTLH